MWFLKRGCPTIFHITHHKAGSQWIYNLLSRAVPDRIVAPRTGNGHFFEGPLKKGRVYPTVYVAKDQFDEVKVPADSRCFVVIRDLRDTMISGYFSLKISHPVLQPHIQRKRLFLASGPEEQGLLWMIDHWVGNRAILQLSWLRAGCPLVKYEDLLENDIKILERVLLDECELSVARWKFRKLVVENRFEHLSAGRRRGEEDVHSHYRKGIAGDWKNHFTDRIKQAFKAKFGDVLIRTGYEKDLNW